MREGYRNRQEAGRVLGQMLTDIPGLEDEALILALPRGGVPVAFEVAQQLRAPLDLMIVRKLGFPGHEELAMGAIASGGSRVIDQRVVGSRGITQAKIDQVVEAEQRELQRREQAYRGDRPEPEVRGRPVVLVDDGIATGSSMRSAAAAVRDRGPSQLIVAVPVAPPGTEERFDDLADQFVCPLLPPGFRAVGQYYADFEQTTDEQVRDLLRRAWADAPEPSDDQRSSPSGI